MVLTCAFNKGVCPSMPTSAPNYGHVPVDMALKNPHVQAAWTCSHAGKHRESDSRHCASEATCHGERKRMCLSIYANEMHLIMGGGTSLWTCSPWPCACAHSPKKLPHQLISSTMSCHMSARQRAGRQPGPRAGPPVQCPNSPRSGNAANFSTRRNCGSTTVSTTTAPEELARPAHQGNKPPCQRATGESPWSPGPWGSASASRQGCPARPNN